MLPVAFLTRAASLPYQIRLRYETATHGPSPVPHTAAERHPIDSGQPKLGRARIWPMGVRVIEGPPAKRASALVLLQPLALRQVSRRRRAIRFQAHFYSTTPATARLLLPERAVQAARSLQQSQRKYPRGRIARQCQADN